MSRELEFPNEARIFAQDNADFTVCRNCSICRYLKRRKLSMTAIAKMGNGENWCALHTNTMALKINQYNHLSGYDTCTIAAIFVTVPGLKAVF